MSSHSDYNSTSICASRTPLTILGAPPYAFCSYCALKKCSFICLYTYIQRMPFFLSHIAGVREIAKLLKMPSMSREYSLAVLGSILPDMEYAGFLKGAHTKSRDFLEFVFRKNKRMVPFAVGMLCHTIQDKILEPKYVEPRETVARKILDKYYPGTVLSRLGSHTLVEQAMDTLLVKQDPSLADSIDDAWRAISQEDINSSVSLLAEFFHEEPVRLHKMISIVRSVRSARFAKPGGISKLWLQCMAAISEEHNLKEHTHSIFEKISSAVRLGTKLSVFSMAHGTYHCKRMLEQAQEVVHDVNIAQKNAFIALRKKFSPLAPRLRRHCV